MSATGDATSRFFDELAARGHEPALEQSSGTIRFDLADGEQTLHWLVSIEKGDISVSRRDANADCLVHADMALFDGIASGEVNAMAAVLRGAFEFEGDTGLLLAFQRLLPGPPRKAG